MPRVTRNLLVAFVVLTSAAVCESAAWACPGCKEATSEQGANLARGFSYSILFMMPLPFVILGGFGGYVFYIVRRREREQAAANSAAQDPVESRST